MLIHGAAGNVGSYAVTPYSSPDARAHKSSGRLRREIWKLRALGADQVLDYRGTPFEHRVHDIDVVIDLVGGDTRRRSWDVLKPGGILVAASESFSDEDQRIAKDKGVRTAFVESDVTVGLLNQLTELLDANEITAQVGTILPLNETRRAHEMIESHQHPLRIQ